ncbi:MAG: metallophosphoesterase [Planctomycetota bacterium]
MFGWILIAAITIMQAGVFLRADSARFGRHRIPRRVLIIAGIALWALFVLGRSYGHEGTGAAARMVEAAGMLWMGTVFLLWVCMLVVEHITGYGWWLRSRVPALRGAALVAGGLLALIAIVQGHRTPVVRAYEVVLPGLPAELDGTVIVGISDVHAGSTADMGRLGTCVDLVMAQRADMVVMLGDMVEGHGTPPPEFTGVLGRLKAPLGVWGVPGNHERFGRDDAVLAALRDAGVRVLRNESVEARPGLVLVGVDDLDRRHAPDGTDPLPQAFAGRPPGATILLTHSPLKLEEAAGAGAELMLCGHTHGGQIWPFS